MDNKLYNGSVEELEVIYGSQASFYRKAMVKTSGDVKFLYSYDTLVAITVGVTPYVTKNVNNLSNTTLKHIKEFYLQYADVDTCKLHKKNYLSDEYLSLDEYNED